MLAIRQTPSADAGDGSAAAVDNNQSCLKSAVLPMRKSPVPLGVNTPQLNEQVADQFLPTHLRAAPASSQSVEQPVRVLPDSELRRELLRFCEEQHEAKERLNTWHGQLIESLSDWHERQSVWQRDLVERLEVHQSVVESAAQSQQQLHNRLDDLTRQILCVGGSSPSIENGSGVKMGLTGRHGDGVLDGVGQQPAQVVPTTLEEEDRLQALLVRLEELLRGQQSMPFVPLAAALRPVTELEPKAKNTKVPDILGKPSRAPGNLDTIKHSEKEVDQSLPERNSFDMTASPKGSRKHVQQEDVHSFQALKGWQNPATGLPQKLILKEERDPLQYATLILVISNTLFIGLQIQIRLNSALDEEESPMWLWLVDILFVIGFTSELTVRAATERIDFFLGGNRYWNLFDFLLILSSILDAVGSIVPNLAYFRTVRVLRAARATRVLKSLRFVREFRLMVASIACSIGSLFWAFALLVSVLYMFDLIILEGVIQFLETHTYSDIPPKLELFYGVSQSMLTLFMVISGGVDWFDLLQPIEQLGTAYVVVFIFYIIFVMYGVLNILTAIFCESAKQIAEIDRDLVIQSEMDRNNSSVNALSEILHSADTDRSGTLTLEEFEEHMGQPETAAYLQFLECDVSTARGLFKLLDVEGDGEVAIEELLNGLMRMKGKGKSLDVAELVYENKRIVARLTALSRFVEDRFEALGSAMHVTHQRMKECTSSRSSRFSGSVAVA